ncbi:electron transport complex subunit RsxG [Fontimonas sp. SYSU GA230001]|uniref:electron transport complex subunit RsxG n=1 Tax=Fontimonas sp. SYSU GA230001 TaxID=3142450 RepID=UPI0032B589FE
MSADLRPVLRSSQVLGLIAVVVAALLGGIYMLTVDRIRAAENERLLLQLRDVLPQGSFDNDIAADRIEVTAAALDGERPVVVYRARRDRQPVAAVLTVTAADGYSGPIRLLVGIGSDGRITGVRVAAHRETPGLGDRIDSRRSDWILGFDGRSLHDPSGKGWGVKKDGGVFDQFAGATITPRAVVKAVHRSLEYFEQNRDALFAVAPGGSSP